MKSLDRKLRNDLERAIIQARRIAEDAAQDALNRLAVGDTEPFKNMSPEDRALRIKLRARGRQLGDSRDQRTKRQAIDHLAIECAYEHWHQMLFARFLAENHLLMHPDGVAVTLEECEEIAKEEGVRNGWVLAAHYASIMLPQIFRPDDALLQIQFAPEKELEVENLLNRLDSEVFQADDSLGWVYQFWQSDKKEDVNRSEGKIGPDELPAVTQLFTEDYMVLFLLHNTIGAWWISNHPGQKPPVDFEYIRFNEDGLPAAGAFEGWPKRVRDLTVLDPCCGSGHFLVGAFILLTYLLADDEGIPLKDACDIVVKNCLFGLEIDARCTQIAAFALALAAWKLPNTGNYRILPKLNIACSGLSIGVDKNEWLSLVKNDTRMQAGMERLYKLFAQAPILGSLIDPQKAGYNDMMEASFAEIYPVLKETIQSKITLDNADIEASSVVAQGVAFAAELLMREYSLVVTNVPYLGLNRQAEPLRKYIENRHALAKQDLATAFVERCLTFCKQSGVCALVTPQNWLFLGSYRHLRKKLLEQDKWLGVAKLGPNAFQEINGEVVKGCLVFLAREEHLTSHSLFVVDVASSKTPDLKAFHLKELELDYVNQNAQTQNPDMRILQAEQTNGLRLLSDYAYSAQGIGTTDNPQFVQKFWEQNPIQPGWEYFQTAATEDTDISGYNSIFCWTGVNEKYFAQIKKLKAVNRIGGGWQAGSIAWGKSGFAVNVTGTKLVTVYSGFKFDTTIGVIIVKDKKHLKPVYHFLKSKEYTNLLSKIDPSLSVTEGTLVKVPFDIEFWNQVANEQNVLIDPNTVDPTQWSFQGQLEGSTEPLQVAVMTLLGYNWPNQRPHQFSEFIDDDGAVCIPALLREKPASERLRELLAASYGTNWSQLTEAEHLKRVGYGNSNLEDWLRNGFFEHHSRIFHQRPCIWHIWDGRKDGFSILVNYHKFDRNLLQKIIYSYLREWIEKQASGVDRGDEGADSRLVAAKELERKLLLILEGEKPLDIFVRWKPLEEQPIGWDPDQNDGIRINIRPFVEANILRRNPNIKWGKDRGKNPPESPWGDERINDIHLSLKEKLDAREKASKNK